MARIRSVHPGQWTDEDFVACSAMARLLAIALRNVADDQGVFEWKPLGLKMQIFPADAVDVLALLGELSSSGQVREFEASGKRYGAIRNFRKWQRPEKPKAIHPLPDHLRAFVGLSAGDPRTVADALPTDPPAATDPSPTIPQTVADPSPTDRGNPPQRKEEGGRRGEETSLRSGGAVRAAGPAAPPPDAKGALYREGMDRLIRLTGKQRDPAAALLGRWMKGCNDDAALIGLVLTEAEAARPADPVAWIEGALRSRRGGGPARTGPPPRPTGAGSPAWMTEEAFERMAAE